MRAHGILGLLLCAAASLAAAKTPIDAPATIDKPGSYVVRRNLRSIETPVLVIAADNVVIDLDGHTLTTERSVCCVVAIQPTARVRIENGSIAGAGSGIGIMAQGSSELALTSLSFGELSTAVRLVDSRSATLRHNRVARGIGVGFELSGSSGFVVQDNTIEAATGLLLKASSSVISGNFFGGELPTAPLVLLPTASGVAVRDNIVRSNGPGILIHGSRNLLQGNVVQAAGCGLWFGPDSVDNLYRANTARGPAPGCACPVTPRGTLCDEGTGNLSHGDNYLPEGG